MSGFEMFLVRSITAVMLFFMTLINSITGVGTIMEKPADINGKTNVEKNSDEVFAKTGEAEIRYEGNKLMLKVSKALVGSADGFTFKWADNYIGNDVNSFYTKGDAAPYGRLCYRY